jgi:hypothetical protein
MHSENLDSLVIVCIADDIFFREGVSSLDLDYLYRLVSFASKPVLNPALDENVLTVMEQARIVVSRYLSCAAHDHPVFVALLVTLQAEAMPRIYQ